MNLEWFATIPGILISGGVLLLIVALIIFIATSSKKGKNVNTAVQSSIDGANQMASNGALGGNPGLSNQTSIVDFSSPEVTPNAIGDLAGMPAQTVPPTPVTESAVSVGNIGPAPAVSEGVNSSFDTSTNIEPSVTPSVSPVMSSEPTIENVSNVESTAPVMEAAPVIESVTPVVDTSTVSNPAVSPVVDVAVTPSSDDVMQSGPTIYGGADPTSNINLNTNESNQIYGGADPLENTQIVPTNEINNASQNSVTPVTPVVDVIPATPAVVPEVAPIAPVTSVEQVSPVTPVTPEVTPVVSASSDVTPPVTPIQ